MILVDTSVWVEHLGRGVPQLAALLEAGEVFCHPYIIGELACGNLRRRDEILALLAALPSLAKVSDEEALEFIARHQLQGKGMGLVDIHLLAASALARQPLWTLDTRLARAAVRLGLAID